MGDTLTTPRTDPRLARVVDVVVATALLLLAAPVLLVAALLIRAGGGPVLFTQRRLGRGCVPFDLHKLRTLAEGPGDPVAAANDPRATRIGRWLRRFRVDELPQLVDVLRGRMALVGPRPEVPANLAAVPRDDLARVLAVRPGITGPTQLRFVAEDDVLAGVDEPAHVYRDVIVPHKVREDLAWLGRRTLCSDLAVLLKTPFTLLSHRARARSRARVSSLLDTQQVSSLRPHLPDE
jgi:lipopolysaccharide/colanic/teichoic acid biosynthesis glycosyltransferase